MAYTNYQNYYIINCIEHIQKAFKKKKRGKGKALEVELGV